MYTSHYEYKMWEGLLFTLPYTLNFKLTLVSILRPNAWRYASNYLTKNMALALFNGIDSLLLRNVRGRGAGSVQYRVARRTSSHRQDK